MKINVNGDGNDRQAQEESYCCHASCMLIVTNKKNCLIHNGLMTAKNRPAFTAACMYT